MTRIRRRGPAKGPATNNIRTLSVPLTGDPSADALMIRIAVDRGPGWALYAWRQAGAS